MSRGSGWHSVFSLWLTCHSSHCPSAAYNSRPVNSQPCFGTIDIQGTDGPKDRSTNTSRWTLHELCLLTASRPCSQDTEPCGHSSCSGLHLSLPQWNHCLTAEGTFVHLFCPRLFNSRENIDLLRSRSLSYHRAFSNYSLLSPPWVLEG